jgi:hypothetical protein
MAEPRRKERRERDEVMAVSWERLGQGGAEQAGMADDFA